MQIKFRQYKANSFNRDAIPTRHCFNACSSSSLYCSGLLHIFHGFIAPTSPSLRNDVGSTVRLVGCFFFVLLFIGFFTDIHGNPFSFFDPILTIERTNLSFLIISLEAFQAFVLFTREKHVSRQSKPLGCFSAQLELSIGTYCYD